MRNTILSVVILLGLSSLTSVNAQSATGAQRLAAFTKQQALLAQSPYKDLPWRLVGPDVRSGRCTDVAGVPGNPDIMYAAFATGGLWKTTDRGNSWFPLFDKQATQSMGNIALAPSNPDILYVGTGEANIFRSSLPGAGIYSSQDAGKTFQHLGLENTGTIARIIVHPTDPKTVYVAASGNEWSYNKERGVYLTNDGGKTWKNILFVNDHTGCIDLAIDPTDPKIIYASMWNRIRRRWSDPVPEDGDHIYKTVDGGKTWKIIGEGLPDTKLTGRIGLAVAYSNPNIVYAFVDDHNKKRDPNPGETDSYQRQVQKVVIGGAIYRSSDKGETWTKMGEVHDYFKPFSGTYGWVFSQIRVHPQNANRIYAFGVNKGISQDGGKSWKIWDPTDTTSDYTHGDNHAMWFDLKNTDHMIVGNDGGVTMTMNAGVKWKNYFDKLPTTQFYTVTYDMEKPFNIFGAVQDEGTMSGNETNTFGKSSDEKLRPWRMAPGGEGTQIQVDPENSNIVFSSSYYGRLMRTDMSLSDTVRQRPIKLFSVGAVDSLRADWLAGTLISKYDHNRIYHGLQHLYQSDDGGKNWTMISPDLSYNDKSHMGVYPYLIYHQAITSIAEGNIPNALYAGTDDGRVWKKDANKTTWTEITKGLPMNKYVARIVPSRFIPGRVYVVLNDRRQDNITPYIYVTADNGATWKPVSSNLPAAPVNCLAEDLDNPQILFCGTDIGVYMTKNGGKSWIALNGNIPASVAVDDLFIHPRDKKLVIGTYGRGVYILDDIQPLQK